MEGLRLIWVLAAAIIKDFSLIMWMSQAPIHEGDWHTDIFYFQVKMDFSSLAATLEYIEGK